MDYTNIRQREKMKRTLGMASVLELMLMMKKGETELQNEQVDWEANEREKGMAME